MSRFWNERTRALSPYVAGEQPRPGERLIKLNTNENPYSVSETVRERLLSFDPATLRLYPDPSSRSLREALAADFGVTPDMVFCGNGSDEVLAFCFQAFFETAPGAAPLFFPDISYSFYPVYAKLFGIPTERIPLNADFTVPVERFCEPSGGVAIANPNAPTSLALGTKDIRRIIESQPDRLVLIDQAYAAFGTEDCVPLLSEYSNLLIVGTLSKSHSLAGLRVGFAIASPEIIEGICRVRDSFNSYPVDMLALELATLAVKDRPYVESNIEKIIRTREAATLSLQDLGFTVLPSQTNFLFVRPDKIPAEELYKKLRGAGILVRYFAKPRIDDYLRITVGTDEQMSELLQEIKRIYSLNSAADKK